MHFARHSNFQKKIQTKNWHRNRQLDRHSLCGLIATQSANIICIGIEILSLNSVKIQQRSRCSTKPKQRHNTVLLSIEKLSILSILLLLFFLFLLDSVFWKICLAKHYWIPSKYNENSWYMPHIRNAFASHSCIHTCRRQRQQSLTVCHSDS